MIPGWIKNAHTRGIVMFWLKDDLIAIPTTRLSKKNKTAQTGKLSFTLAKKNQSIMFTIDVIPIPCNHPVNFCMGVAGDIHTKLLHVKAESKPQAIESVNQDISVARFRQEDPDYVALKHVVGQYSHLGKTQAGRCYRCE